MKQTFLHRYIYLNSWLGGPDMYDFSVLGLLMTSLVEFTPVCETLGITD